MTTRHIIIGGGPVATNALETIRQFDGGSSEITLISDEPAHSRMALPYWLSGQVPREHTHTADKNYYKQLGVDAQIGTRVDKIDPNGKAVTLADGATLNFDKLLIATGASPAGLPVPGADLPNVQPLWSLAHTESLLDATSGIEQPRVLMIGAGFIGFIMLNAMFKRKWTLSVVERETHVLPRMLDDEAAGFVERWLEKQGVDVHVGANVKSISEADDGAKVVECADGTTLTVDVVIIATGIKPNLECVENSGIDVNEGIVVNNRMQTNFPDIYAGGDIAEAPQLFGGSNSIHAIQTTAVDHGRVAGANMAGEDIDYPGSLLMNILDVCGLQNASFGDWSGSGDETMTISSESNSVYRKLVWSGDQITGAIFVGKANDVGMLTDVGMIKGIMQTQTGLGEWKAFLKENPFDIRRAYAASGIAKKLVDTTLLGRPSVTRGYQAVATPHTHQAGDAHSLFVNSKLSS